MKIFFDTNVLIASFLGSYSCAEIIEDAYHHYDVIYTDHLIKEINKVLDNKFHFDKKLIKEFIDFIENYFIYGKTAGKIEKVCRDKNDDYILADALINNIDFIITGDNDLLELNKYKSIRIILPKDYWKIRD